MLMYLTFFLTHPVNRNYYLLWITKVFTLKF